MSQIFLQARKEVFLELEKLIQSVIKNRWKLQAIILGDFNRFWRSEMHIIGNKITK